MLGFHDHYYSVNLSVTVSECARSIVEWMVNNGTFSATFFPESQLYFIVANDSVSATDIIVPSRLTTTNFVLLTLGVVVWCAAIAGVCSVVLFIKIKGIQVSVLPMILLILGVVVPAVLWVAVGFHVGLQDSTCDAAWQQTRDALVISSFNFSIFSILLVAMASATLFTSHGVTTRTPHEVEGSTGNEGVVYDEILESTRQQGTGNTTGLGTIPLKANTAYQRGMNN